MATYCSAYTTLPPEQLLRLHVLPILRTTSRRFLKPARLSLRLQHKPPLDCAVPGDQRTLPFRPQDQTASTHGRFGGGGQHTQRLKLTPANPEATYRREVVASRVLLPRHREQLDENRVQQRLVHRVELADAELEGLQDQFLDALEARKPRVAERSTIGRRTEPEQEGCQTEPEQAETTSAVSRASLAQAQPFTKQNKNKNLNYSLYFYMLVYNCTAAAVTAYST